MKNLNGKKILLIICGGIYAKKARGEMIHYIVKNFISNPNLLKNYTESGYTFNSSISTENDWVFTRD